MPGQAMIWRHLVITLVLGLCPGLCWSKSQHPRIHAWSRDVGHQGASHLSRRQKKRLGFGSVRDVPLAAGEVEAQIRTWQQHPLARVRRIGRGRHGNAIYRIDVPPSSLSTSDRKRPLRARFRPERFLSDPGRR